VTDRAQARETAKLLGQSLKEYHSVVGDPFKALREAVKAFREAHKPANP
jgi:asparagine synthetase B (glutamine-hydrolysing)